MDSLDKYFEGYRTHGIDFLRKTVEGIQNIEALSDLHDLKLVQQCDVGALVMLKYEASAPNLFPAVRQRLLDKKVAKRHNILHTSVENQGTPEEIYNVTLGFYGNRVQVSLNIRR